MNPSYRIVFYVSGHGFGHTSRVIEVIHAVLRARPDARIVVKTSAPHRLFARTLQGRCEVVELQCDAGIVQIDSLNLDASESVRQAVEFQRRLPALAEAEAAYLRGTETRLAVGDIPPLAVAAARAAGIPSVLIGNFTWDWIYEHYDGGAALAKTIGKVYEQTTLALRFPMWGGFETMPRVQDIPLVARQSRRDPDEVRRALGIPIDKRIALTSFGGYGLDGLNEAALRSIEGYLVLLPGMIDERAMYDRGYRYEDLVRAVDVVVTKPGYGIISECIANDTALLYTSRGDFREYQVLVDAMPAVMRCAFIDHAGLFSGNWKPHLDALLAQPDPPVRPATNGAGVAADILLQILG